MRTISTASGRVIQQMYGDGCSFWMIQDQAGGPQHVTQRIELDDQDATPELVDARAGRAFHALALVERAGLRAL